MDKQCKFAHGKEELDAWNQATGKPPVTAEELNLQVAINADREKRIRDRRAMEGLSISAQQQGRQDAAPQRLRRPPPISASQKSISGYRLCEYFQRTGTCAQGEYCRFPHGELELQHWRQAQALEVKNAAELMEQSPSHTQPPIRELPFELRNRGKDPVLCANFFLLGTCGRGNECVKAHSLLELNTWTEVKGVSTLQSMQIMRQQQMLARSENSNLDGAEEVMLAYQKQLPQLGFPQPLQGYPGASLQVSMVDWSNGGLSNEINPLLIDPLGSQSAF